jgi:hypothetical protein
MKPSSSTLGWLSVIGLLAACTSAEPDRTGIVNNDAVVLARSVSALGQTVEVDDNHGTQDGCGLKSRKLTLVAEVAPPTLDGKKLQAVDIVIRGETAIVGFNTAGDEFRGGIQVISLSDRAKPRLISEAILPSTDVNSILADGSDLFLGESTDTNNALPSSAEHWKLTTASKLEHSVMFRPGLRSYAVTGLLLDKGGKGGTLYATVGAAEGGVVALDPTTLAERAFFAIEDARSIAAGPDNTLVVLAGTPARLYVLNKDLIEKRHFNLKGATIPYSKSTVEVYEDIAFVAVGDGGFQVIDLNNGAVLSKIANPIVPGLDATKTVTNAARTDKLTGSTGWPTFLANGEAGVRMACIGEDFSATVLGTLRFGTKESVNGLAFKNHTLIIPTGTGGVRIVDVD